MEQLANLPPLALIAFGGTLAVIFAARYFGMQSGRTVSPEKSQSAAQVAAVIVDSTALNKATIALESHTLATNRLVASVDTAAKAIEEFSQEADKVREELRITREISRRER